MEGKYTTHRPDGVGGVRGVCAELRGDEKVRVGWKPGKRVESSNALVDGRAKACLLPEVPLAHSALSLDARHRLL